MSIILSTETKSTAKRIGDNIRKHGSLSRDLCILLVGEMIAATDAATDPDAATLSLGHVADAVKLAASYATMDTAGQALFRKNVQWSKAIAIGFDALPIETQFGFACGDVAASKLAKELTATDADADADSGEGEGEGEAPTKESAAIVFTRADILGMAASAIDGIADMDALSGDELGAFALLANAYAALRDRVADKASADAAPAKRVKAKA